MQENKSQKIWNDVKSDLVAGVCSFSQCIALGDLLNDNDNKLICGDVTNKIKVFKQECLVSEVKLDHIPVSIQTYRAYNNQTKSILLYLAVAGGSYIFIFKNMKKHFKLTVPNVEINSLEVQIWEDLKNNKLENNVALQQLKDMANQSNINVITNN